MTTHETLGGADRTRSARALSNPLRSVLAELSGSLGDLGTFLPLAVALTMVNGLDIAAIFLFAGLMNIATGVIFRQPIPVQPMKAIAAVAIAEGLAPGAIAAAGIGMGVVMTALALFGVVAWVDRVVPRPVIRGIQAGIGAKLILTGLAWIAELPTLGLDSALVAMAVGLAVAATSARRIPMLLLVFGVGLALAWIAMPSPPEAFRGAVPIQPIRPTGHEWAVGLMRGAVPQLPLTLLNSVLAVCALSADLYPDRGIEPRRMAMSVGMMNLVAVPLGGMPMCHGSGGLAAQHRFGARTGLSVVMLGTAKIAVALMLGGALLPMLHAFPRSVLAAMLIFAGFTLMRPAAQSLGTVRAATVMLSTAMMIVAFGTLEGFTVGAAIAAITARTPHAPGQGD